MGKRAIATLTAWTREDSAGPLDPEKAVHLKAGDVYPDDAPIVIDRPELFEEEQE